MKKNTIWWLLLLLTVAMTGIYLSGFIRVANITGSDKRGSLMSETEKDLASDGTGEGQESNNDINTDRKDAENPDEGHRSSSVLLVLGDSIGAGVGDERQLGIGGRFLMEMEFEKADRLEVVNFAIPGAETQELDALVTGGQIDMAIEQSAYIVISIGGNNLNRLQNSDSASRIIGFEERLAEHLTALSNIFKYLRSRNPVVPIAVLGLYDPFGEETVMEDQRLLQEWNHQTGLLMLDYDAVHMIPLYAVFINHLDAYLSIDRFHPSGEGYQKIAEMIGEVVLE